MTSSCFDYLNFNVLREDFAFFIFNGVFLSFTVAIMAELGVGVLFPAKRLLTASLFSLIGIVLLFVSFFCDFVVLNLFPPRSSVIYVRYFLYTVRDYWAIRLRSRPAATNPLRSRSRLTLSSNKKFFDCFYSPPALDGDRQKREVGSRASCRSKQS